jgi:hypothetical protein
MKRATVTISDEIEANLDAYIRQQGVSPPLPAIMQAALQEFLSRRGFHSRRPQVTHHPREERQRRQTRQR